MPDLLLPCGKSFSVFLWDRASMTVISVSALSLCKRKTKRYKEACLVKSTLETDARV